MKKESFCLNSIPKAKVCCGIDEVGRGPLAGPVVAAAVILPVDFFCDEIKDSKKLKRAQIKRLSDIIKLNATAYAIGVVTPDIIDKTDILNATFLAMKMAVDELSLKPDVILIDGNLRNPYLLQFEQYPVVDGDALVPTISAASIIAKDYRDTLMEEYAKLFPEYFFEKHKGYGTKLHIEMIRKYGLSSLHRKSFCRKFIETKQRGFFE